MPPPTLASKATSTPGLRRGLEDLLAVHREQRLVGGDDVLAALDGAQHQAPRGAVAADQLDHDLDGGVVDQAVRVGVEARRRRGRRRGRARGRGRRRAPGAAGSRAARRSPPRCRAAPSPRRCRSCRSRSARRRRPRRPSRPSPPWPSAARAAQEAADAAHRLAGAVHVLDQREAHVALAALAEADARRDRDLAPRAAGASRTRASRASGRARGSAPRRTSCRAASRSSRRPAPGWARPSISASRRAWYSSTFSVDAVLGPAQRHDRADLDRLGHAVVEVALDARRARGPSRGCRTRSRRASRPSSGSSRARRTRSRRPWRPAPRGCSAPCSRRSRSRRRRSRARPSGRAPSRRRRCARRSRGRPRAWSGCAGTR